MHIYETEFFKFFREPLETEFFPDIYCNGFQKCGPMGKLSSGMCAF